MNRTTNTTKLEKLLDMAIELGKKEFGVKTRTRYSCPVTDEYGYRCSDTEKKPLKSYNEFCSKHGNLIEAYETDAYDSQPWQDAFNNYFYNGKFGDDK